MNYIYKTTESIITDETGISYCVYGVSASRIGELTPEKTIDDIFTEFGAAQQFVSLCNSLELDPDQLYDVVADVLASME